MSCQKIKIHVTSYEKVVGGHFKCVILYVRIKIYCKTLSQILGARRHCREEPRSNGMDRLSKLYDVLGKLLRRQYNEWCQYREKTFQSFYARRHGLINVAFMFYIVDGIAKSPTHVTKFDYPAEMTDGLQSFDRKRFRHGVFASIYSDMRWKNNDKTMWCVNVY